MTTAPPVAFSTELQPLTSTNISMTSTLRSNMTAPAVCIIMDTQSRVPWDNPDDLVSRDTEQAVDRAVALAFLPILFIISSSSNILNALVFWRQGLKERIQMTLFCLAWVDLVYMLHAFLMNVDRIHHSAHGKDDSNIVGPVLQFIVENKLVGIRGLTWVSGLLTTLIACERCFIVVSPLKAKTLLDTQTSAILIAVTSTIVLAGFFLVGTRWGTACVYDPLTNTISTTIYASDFYIHNRQLLDVLDGLVYGMILPVIFITVVTATTVVTLIKLRQMSAWRENTSSGGAVSVREVALTRMLIGVSVLYVICEIFTLVTGLLIWFVPDFSLQGRYYNAFNMMISVWELSTYINSSLNFFIYCFLGSRFKETLKEIFVCSDRFKRQRNLYADESSTKQTTN